MKTKKKFTLTPIKNPEIKRLAADRCRSVAADWPGVTAAITGGGLQAGLDYPGGGGRLLA